jgi:hydrogenase maturation protease
MTDSATRTAILIVGFGNPLMGDDGVGAEVVRLLAARLLPAGVRVVDGGSDALRLPGLWRGEREVWLVDAVAGRGRGGDVVHLEHEKVLAVPQVHTTAHALSLPEALRWIALSYPEMAEVRYRFWGIVVGNVSPHPELSTEAVQGADRVVREIVRALGRRPHEPAT